MKWTSLRRTLPWWKYLVGYEVLLFLALQLGDLVGMSTGLTALYGWDSFLVFYPESDFLARHPWTLISYTLVHQNGLHLLLNMLLLIFWGKQLESNLPGGRVFLGVYIGGALAGALSYWLGYLISTELGGWFIAPRALLGCSAGILSLAFACSCATPRRKIQLGGLRLNGLAASVFLLLATLILPGLDNVGGTLAHLGGAAVGVVLGLRLGRKSTQPPEQEDPALEVLLKKIRRSGYTSLSLEERRRLIHHTRDTSPEE